MNFRNTVRGRTVNHRVARMRSVQESVKSHAMETKARAQANLASRRITGEHTITAKKGVTDWYITLSGPGALALEVGHHNKWSGEFVEGTRILRNALHGSAR